MALRAMAVAGRALGGHRAAVAALSCHPTLTLHGHGAGEGRAGTGGPVPSKLGDRGGGGGPLHAPTPACLHLGTLRCSCPVPAGAGAFLGWAPTAAGRPPGSSGCSVSLLSQDYVDALLTNYCVSAGGTQLVPCWPCCCPLSPASEAAAGSAGPSPPSPSLPRSGRRYKSPTSTSCR